MPDTLLSRPARDECAPYYLRYIDQVPEGDLILLLVRQAEEQRNLLAGRTEETAGHRYAEGKWSVKEVVGHLLDTERVMSYRLLRIARGDVTPLAGFDENAYVNAAQFDRISLRRLRIEYDAVRQATLELLRDLTDEELSLRGVANNSGVSARALAWIIAGHERHHQGVLRERYGLSS